METEIEEFIPTRRSLITRLKNWDDQKSWKAFFDTYWKMIYSVARQAGLNDADAQDVVQETILSVAKKMPQFRYDPSIGSFKAWLRTITQCRIADQFRKKVYERAGKRHLREEHVNTSLLDEKAATTTIQLEKIWNQEWHKHLMESAMENIKQRVSPKHYQLFYLHICKGYAAKEVARKLDVKLTEVYFAKYKVSILIEREIRRLEKKVI